MASSTMKSVLCGTPLSRKTPFNSVVGRRDLDLPQNVRDGIDQFKGDLEGTKKRDAVAIARLKKELPPKIEKSYWTQGREELRLELVGTLRSDLNTIASSLGDKATKKAARAVNDKFFSTVEVLDGAMRAKNQEATKKALDKTIAALDSVTIG